MTKEEFENRLYHMVKSFKSFAWCKNEITKFLVLEKCVTAEKDVLAKIEDEKEFLEKAFPFCEKLDCDAFFDKVESSMREDGFTATLDKSSCWNLFDDE